MIVQHLYIIFYKQIILFTDFDHEVEEPVGFEMDPSSQIPDRFEEPSTEDEVSPVPESDPAKEHIEGIVFFL